MQHETFRNFLTSATLGHFLTAEAQKNFEEKNQNTFAVLFTNAVLKI